MNTSENKKTIETGKIIYDMSMSLDGFIAATNARPEAGLGDDGERLHDWGFNSADPRNREIAEAWLTMGAIIYGRTTYDHSIRYWGANGPTGDARVPTIIVSHDVPKDIPDAGVYTFVGSIEAGLKAARKPAGNKDIGLQGGNVAQQFIALGLVDEIFIHLVPVLFGCGTRMIDNLDGKHIRLESTEVIQTKEATHLRFRVIK